jgi:hypothetical protein
VFAIFLVRSHIFATQSGPSWRAESLYAGKKWRRVGCQSQQHRDFPVCASRDRKLASFRKTYGIAHSSRGRFYAVCVILPLQDYFAFFSRSRLRSAAKRMPGRSVGEPINSMPAASNAAFTSSRVDERLGGTSSSASNRLIVLAVTPALFANCSEVQRRAFRAERI